MSTSSFKLLVVDNNLSEALLLKHALTHIQSDLSVYLITDRRSVPDYLNRTSPAELLSDEARPSLVILHASLPDYSAMKTLKWIRKDERFDSMIIAMLAPYENPRERALYEEAGANGYFVQPIHDHDYTDTAKDILNHCKVLKNAYDHLDQEDIRPSASARIR